MRLAAERKLLELVSRRFNMDPSDMGLDEDIFERLGINSLQALDLLCALEMEFGVTIPDSKMSGIRTFRHLVDIVTPR